MCYGTIHHLKGVGCYVSDLLQLLCKRFGVLSNRPGGFRSPILRLLNRPFDCLQTTTNRFIHTHSHMLPLVDSLTCKGTAASCARAEGDLEVRVHENCKLCNRIATLKAICKAALVVLYVCEYGMNKCSGPDLCFSHLMKSGNARRNIFPDSEMIQTVKGPTR